MTIKARVAAFGHDPFLVLEMFLGILNEVVQHYQDVATVAVLQEGEVEIVDQVEQPAVVIAAIVDVVKAVRDPGTWAQGDVIRNATPAEAGSAGSKYVVTGWICTASGAPGTWLQCRVLTGN